MSSTTKAQAAIFAASNARNAKELRADLATGKYDSQPELKANLEREADDFEQRAKDWKAAS